MTAVVVLLVAAVLLWPGRGAPGVPPRWAGRPSGGLSSGRAGAARSASPTTVDVAEAARLVAAALRSGIAVTEALEVVAALGPPATRADLRVVVAASRWGLPSHRCWEQVGAGWRPLGTALTAADEAGLSPVRALEAAAAQLDRERRARVREAVRRVEVLVVLPLGLAFLPGFVLAAVVPLVLGLATGLAG